MNTDDLIATLADDLEPLRPRRLLRRLATGLACGTAVTILLFAVFWGIRPDAGVVLHDAALFAKTALPLGLAVLAWPWLLARARPGGQSPAAYLVAAVPLIGGVFVALALLTTPPTGWGMAAQGKSIATCLVSIPLLAAPILAGLMATLGDGAPDNPAVCGAVAGLLAGAGAAAVYSLYCVENSPLFYGVWYGLAILAVGICGALAGRWLLRW